MDEQEYRGHWWLPDQYDERVGGVATYSPTTGANIELFDLLVPTAEAMTNSVQHDRIHGRTTDGDKIMLLDVRRRISVGISLGLHLHPDTGQNIYSKVTSFIGIIFHSIPSELDFHY